MTRLQQLYADQGQSPWLDNLTRNYVRDGGLAARVASGIRGVTANPTILSRALVASPNDYGDQIEELLQAGHLPESVFWELAIADVAGALSVLRPVFDESDGSDGFVSIEVAPGLAGSSAASVEAARGLHERIDRPNVMVKIPATPEGIPAIRALVAEGRNINVTLIFSLERYAQVLEAYLSGLEELVRHGGDPSRVHGVASFFVSRVDRAIAKRLAKLDDATLSNEFSGRVGIAQARLAYRMFVQAFAGSRWDALAARGAHPQRILWASTGNKNPALPDTLYIDSLIGPGTVTTIPEATIAAFEDHGTVARTVDRNIEEAEQVLARVAEVGIDMNDVGRRLETEGIDGFQKEMDSALARIASIGRRGTVPATATH